MTPEEWAKVPLGPHERLDDLMVRDRRLIQNEQEFCFSMDAVLLAHFPQGRGREQILELGTGTGVIPLLMADEAAHITAIELNPVMAELAVRNVRLNGLAENIQVLAGDYREIEKLIFRESFDLVVANPPYRPLGKGKGSTLTGVARARHEVTATLEDVCRAARFALRFGGRFALIHLPERLAEIFSCLQKYQLEPKRLRLVADRPGSRPRLALIEARQGGRSGLAVEPALFVREATGEYTRELLEIYGMEGAHD